MLLENLLCFLIHVLIMARTYPAIQHRGQRSHSVLRSASTSKFIDWLQLWSAYTGPSTDSGSTADNQGQVLPALLDIELSAR